MRLFLDTSVLLAAAGSGRGASRFVVTEAIAQGWVLVSVDYCAEEVPRNFSNIGTSAEATWSKSRRKFHDAALMAKKLEFISAQHS